MKGTPARRASGLTSSSGETRPSNAWTSRIGELFRDPDFRLEWDNDFGFHIARNLQELRRYRGLTQAEVAKRAETSQPKVARAESGDSNLTVSTLSRYISALRGRLRFSIEPEELELPQFPVWWDCLDLFPTHRPESWERFTIQVSQNVAYPTRVFAGWEASPNESQSSTKLVLHLSAQNALFSTDSFDLSPPAEKLLLPSQKAD